MPKIPKYYCGGCKLASAKPAHDGCVRRAERKERLATMKLEALSKMKAEQQAAEDLKKQLAPPVK